MMSDHPVVWLADLVVEVAARKPGDRHRRSHCQKRTWWRLPDHRQGCSKARSRGQKQIAHRRIIIGARSVSTAMRTLLVK
jgi:hypothetical protein